MTDHVLPNLHLRQWVLSVPFELRVLLAANPRTLSIVGKISCQEIARWQRERARLLGYRVVRGGAICFPQRFGGSLNLNVHYHVVAPDAAFAKVGECVEALELEAPTVTSHKPSYVTSDRLKAFGSPRPQGARAPQAPESLALWCTRNTLQYLHVDKVLIAASRAFALNEALERKESNLCSVVV